MMLLVGGMVVVVAAISNDYEAHRQLQSAVNSVYEDEMARAVGIGIKAVCLICMLCGAIAKANAKKKEKLKANQRAQENLLQQTEQSGPRPSLQGTTLEIVATATVRKGAPTSGL